MSDTTWTVPPAPRFVEEPVLGDERPMLEGWLDAHRATLRWKVEGLTAQQLKTPSDPPSALTLLGLVRHLADNERWWFRRHGAEDVDLRDIYCTDDWPDADFEGVPDADAAADLATYEAEVLAAREAVAGRSLDDVVQGPAPSRPRSLRWIYLHMIEEYARHNGHADLLREHLDGVTGDFPR
ncbi:DinB family protein [Angustibacter aerolatus]